MTLTAFPPPDPNSVAPQPMEPFAAPTLPAPSAPNAAAPDRAEPGPSLPRRPGHAAPPPNGQGDKPRRIAPLALVLAALAVLMVLIVVAALPVLQDDEKTDPQGGAAPPSSLELRPQPSSAPQSEAPAPESEAPAAEAPAAESEAPAVESEAPAPETVAEQPEIATAPESSAVDTGTVAPDPDPDPVVVPAPDVAAADVPESKAVVRGGQIFLEGAVPTAEAGELIAALAAEILGPDNVFNNYIVDPRASDPNLGNVTVEDTINFATGSATILPEGEGLMNQALALMTIRPSVTVVVVGHTDDRGSDEYNLELSVQRAEAVKRWLTDRGIDGARLTVVGKGEAEPIADNSTSEGQRLNRRIQFFIENLLADS